MTEPVWTPAQAQAATDPIRNEDPPVGVSLPADTQARIGGAVPAEVDVNALWQQMQDQMNAMAAQIAQLRAGQAPEGEHPLIGVAQEARNQLAIHYAHNPQADGVAVLRLADDLIDASKNSVASGDVSAARALSEKLGRLLRRSHPGPGEHHYFNQAVSMVANHYQDAADTVTGPAPKPAGAVSGGAPAKVIAGSVTG